jgi:hypothetical protein
LSYRLLCRVGRFVRRYGSGATVVISKIERGQRLLSDPRIFALGDDWKFNRDVVPIMTTACRAGEATRRETVLA